MNLNSLHTDKLQYWPVLSKDWLDTHHLAKYHEREQMIMDLGITPNASILDIGCGTGGFSVLLSQHAVSPQIIALSDISSEKVIQAQKRCKSYTHNQYQAITVVCDMNRLPYADRSFDLIWCANTLQYSSNPIETVKEFIRATKRGGVVVIKDEDVTRDILLSWNADFENAINNAWFKIAKSKRGQFWDPYIGRKLIGILRLAGLNKIKVKTYLIERTFPFSVEVKEYITKAFITYADDYKIYLSEDMWHQFIDTFNKDSNNYIFKDENIHFISTETVVSGEV